MSSRKNVNAWCWIEQASSLWLAISVNFGNYLFFVLHPFIEILFGFCALHDHYLLLCLVEDWDLLSLLCYILTSYVALLFASSTPTQSYFFGEKNQAIVSHLHT